jgi:hypothetical protein
MRILNAFGGFVIVFATTESPTSTTTESDEVAPCTAQDFEYMSLLDPAVLAEICISSLLVAECLDAQLAIMTGDSTTVFTEGCVSAILGVDTDTESCLGESPSASRTNICQDFAYFASTFLQASKIVMAGACTQDDSALLAVANYTDMANCIADEKNSFSECWSTYPLDVSDSCASLVESSMDGIFETCSVDCPDEDYSSEACEYCTGYGFPIGASYTVYNSASSMMSISFAGLMFIALSMMN